MRRPWTLDVSAAGYSGTAKTRSAAPTGPRKSDNCAAIYEMMMTNNNDDEQTRNLNLPIRLNHGDCDNHYLPICHNHGIYHPQSPSAVLGRAAGRA
jgi:hypothetical protein